MNDPDVGPWWSLVGTVTGELISHRGAVLVHDNRAELEFLIPGQRSTCLGLRRTTIQQMLGRPTILLREHPQMDHITFPLNRDHFQ